MIPKPTKKSRTDEKEAKKAALKEYRAQQRKLAVFRDNGLCTIHYFLEHEEVPYDEVHHVYGRAKEAGHWRENHASLLCVCRDCHPPPIQNIGASKNLGWVEYVMRLANSDPINRDYI